MRSILTLILILLCNYSEAQDFSKTIIDTTIDFNGTSYYPTNGRLALEKEFRIIEHDGSVVYAMFYYPKSKQIKDEYFKIGKGEYYGIEYFTNGTLKAKGNFLVNYSFNLADTVYKEDAETGELIRIMFPYPKLTKTGRWIEYDSLNQHFFVWTGIYDNGKKKGIWEKQFWNDQLLFSVDYSKDSTKISYGENTVKQMNKNSLKADWMVHVCNLKTTDSYFTMHTSSIFKINPIDIGYSGLKLKTDETFVYMNCNSKIQKGKWHFIENNDDKYLVLVFENRRRIKMRVDYFSKDEVLLKLVE